MSQALYRKWRPARFDDVVGQEHITRTLQNSVVADRVGHAYLFCGPRGTGKTTSARLLAKAVNCYHDDLAERPCGECSICKAISNGRFLDLIEIDAASNTGVDDIRDLRDKINFAPSEGRFKVYIIDEVHMLSTAAFNALLKTLEEPPPHAKFILATTEEHKVPMTIKSRCQQFNFRLLTISEIISRLEWLAEKETLTIEPAALALIAQQGAGSLRDSESLLDQLVVIPGDTITLERTQMILGTATNTAVADLTGAWLDGNGGRGLQIIDDALSSGTDARQFARQMVAYLRDLLLLQAGGEDLPLDSIAEQKEAMLLQTQRATRVDLVKAVKGFNEAALTPSNSWQPQLPLELAFIELLPAEPVAALVTHQPAAPVTVKTTPSPVPTPVKEKTAVAEPPPIQPKAEAAIEKQSEPDEPEVAEQPQTAVSATPPSSNLSLAAITTHWREMVSIVGEQNKNLPALLNMGKPIGLEGTTIVLGFDYPIFKTKFSNTPEAQTLIGEAYSQLLNTKVAIRSVVTSEYTVSVTKDEVQALAQELGGVVSEEDPT